MQLVAVHDFDADKSESLQHTLTLVDAVLSAPDANEQAFALVSGTRSVLGVQKLRQIEQSGAAHAWPDEALEGIERDYPGLRDLLKQLASSGKRVRFRSQIQIDVEG